MMELTQELLEATYARDEPAMSKLIDRLSDEELTEFRNHLTILTYMTEYIANLRILNSEN